jgi:hypothetical protein
MNQYDFLGITIGSGSDPDLMVFSTNENIVVWITEQIQKRNPTAKVDNNLIHQDDLPFHNNLVRKFRKLDYTQYSIGFLLFQELCHQGWEPFGDISFSEYGFHRITLRKLHDSTAS